MKKYRMAIGAIIFILGIFICISFNVEYPCTMSGCGCDTVWEMLHDTWSGVAGFFIILLGIGIFIKALPDGDLNEKKKM